MRCQRIYGDNQCSGEIEQALPDEVSTKIGICPECGQWYSWNENDKTYVPDPNALATYRKFFRGRVSDFT